MTIAEATVFRCNPPLRQRLAVLEEIARVSEAWTDGHSLSGGEHNVCAVADGQNAPGKTLYILDETTPLAFYRSRTASACLESTGRYGQYCCGD